MAKAVENEGPEMPGHWVEHRLASWLLRAAVLLIPISAGAGASIAVGRAVERGSGAGEIAWWVMVLAASTITVLLTERVARKLLPLAALLRLSLIFPDKAPSRFSVAMRTMSVRRLQNWANEVTDDGNPVDVTERATAVLSLAAALNVHDRRTRGHSERVSALTALVAEEMDLDAYTTSRLLWGALLHDIGKLSVPREILNKTGAPDAREWRVLVKHPMEGERLAEGLDLWLGGELAAIGQHHEKWDGSGYPNRLVGDEIAQAARIVAVTDAFETMTALRSYNKPLSVAAARTELVECAGTHFDPSVVRSFLNVSIGRLHWSVGVMSWLAQLPFVGALPRAAAQMSTVASSTTASNAAVAGVAALVVTSTLSGVGSSVPPASASVDSGAPSGQDNSEGSSDGQGATRAVSPGGDDTTGTPAPETADPAASTPPPTAAPAPPPPPPAPPQGNGNGGGNGNGQTNGVGNGGTPPGHGGTPPGLDGVVPPGQGGTPPGQGGTPPGQAKKNQ